MGKLLLILSLVGFPPIVFFVGGTVTLFDAPLNTNGMDAADPASTWPVTGVAAPDVAWWGDDPTGAGTATTGTWTAGGNPTAGIDTPFCPDGSHDDVTGCLQAVRFDGNDYYASDAGGAMNPASGDFSTCIVAQGGAASQDMLAVSMDADVGGDGWFISVLGNGAAEMRIRNEAAAASDVDWNTHGLQDAWFLLCLTSDHDGNAVGYANAESDGSLGGPGGVISVAAAATVGATTTGSFGWEGDIAAVFFWNSLLDATDMEELFEYFAGINDNEAAPVAFTSTGPNCMFVDGAIECFSDDWPIIGAELPPGVTGAGDPSSGFYSGRALTQQVPYSRDLDEWTDVGTPVPTDSDTTLFRDGRQTVLITDNDGGAVEGSKSAAITMPNDTGDKTMVCVYAFDADDTVLDLQVDEAGADSCAGGNTVDFAAKTITTAWTQYEWTHTLSSGDCTTAEYKITPGDWGVVANTGSAEVVVQVFTNQDWCPPTYTETSAAAVASGDDYLAYDISGVPGLADIADNTVWSMDAATKAAQFDGFVYFGEIKDDGTGTDYYRWYAWSDEKHILQGRSAEEGAARTMYGETAAEAYTPGTAYNLALTIVSDATTLTFDGGNNAGSNVTLTNAPNSIDTLCVGAKCPGGNQFNGWFSNVKVEK